MNLSLPVRVFSPVALLLAAVGVTGCGHTSSHAGATSQPRTAGAFTRLDVRGPIDVVVHEGRPLAMSVTTEGISPGKVQTRIEGDSLVVDLDGSWCVGICISRQTARLDVDVPSLEGVKINGSGDVTVLGTGTHSKVDVDVNGSGDMSYAGAVDSLSLRLEGSGDVTLNGTGKRVRVELTGSGDIDASDFAIEGGDFDLEGSGDVTADLHGGATSIRVHGSGDFHYKGAMKVTALDISGTGEVEEDGKDEEAKVDRADKDDDKDEDDDK